MLRIGIIGCGRISQVRHVPEYAENPHCSVTAYFDTLSNRAEMFAAEYGGKAYDSIPALLESGVDAVSICVSNEAHAVATIQALQAGCHVLCEKPMATTLQECIDMMEAAEACGKLLLLGHNQRFAKAHIKARQLIADGLIGRVLTFHTRFGHHGPEGWTGLADSWFFDKRQAAFGAIMDLGIHKTDLMHFLLDEPIVEVSAFVSTLDKKHADGSPIHVDDNAICLYRTRSGIPGTMHASWTFYGQEDNSTRIYGTEGILRCYDDPKDSLIFERRDGTIERFPLDHMTTNSEQTSGLRANTRVIDAFVDAILHGKKSPIDCQEALKAMRVIFAAAQSAMQDSRTVWVDH